MINDKIAAVQIRTTLNRLAQRDLGGRSPLRYVADYLPLVRLFQQLALTTKEGTEAIELVQAGCCAVYGWMPTMLKWPPHDQQCQALLKFLSICRERRPTSAELLLVVRCVNGSVVGTSKFLHFACPHLFPIWDSVVAKTFELRYRHQYATPEAYLAYWHAVEEWFASSSELPGNFLSWIGGTPRLAEVGQLRLLEVALYVEGGWREG